MVYMRGLGFSHMICEQLGCAVMKLKVHDSLCANKGVTFKKMLYMQHGGASKFWQPSDFAGAARSSRDVLLVERGIYSDGMGVGGAQRNELVSVSVSV